MAPPAAHAHYASSIYPAPVPLRKGVICDMSQGCHNPAGLEDAGPLRRTMAQSLVSRLSGDLSVKRHASDRTLWPLLGGFRGGSTRVMVSSPRPARLSPYAALIKNGCGRRTFTLSWYVMLCPGQCREAVIHDPALIGYLYLVNRAGRWLAWAAE